jgi:hypothetical protein
MKSGQTSPLRLNEHSAVRRGSSSSGYFGPLDFQLEIGQVGISSIAVAQDAELGLRVAGADGHGGGRSGLCPSLLGRPSAEGLVSASGVEPVFEDIEAQLHPAGHAELVAGGIGVRSRRRHRGQVSNSE